MPEKILFVDDEASVLDGYRRLLHKEFTIETAIGGEHGLSVIKERGPIAVVVSDMRMPQMDGVQFLSRAKILAPDAVRVILTGFADIQTAIDAVNEGNIFRFLTKPCPKENLAKAVLGALTQHRLIVAEKELLENTLRASIQVLTEVLGITNPAAFGRAMRLRRCVQHVVAKLNLGSPWQFEVAAMLSQLGCVTLHPDTVEEMNAGRVLSSEEQSRFDRHPSVAWDLLSRIPRLEAVAWMIVQQYEPISTKQDSHDIERDCVAVGAQLLRIALAYDQLVSRGWSHTLALGELGKKANEEDSAILDALSDLERQAEPTQRYQCQICTLAPGMIVDEDLRTKGGSLVAAKGQEITPPLAMRLATLFQHGTIEGSVLVRISVADSTN
jgi:response regulator RpfG family c-di-GMP phosphodiesterase